MLNYYSRRANEYERIYQKPERQADLALLREKLRHELAGHRVLELACGTGHWTAAIAEAAESVFATDASEEVLEIARSKSLDPARVTFDLGDAYQPARGEPEFTAGFAGFWWSHVPKGKLADFLRGFHAALAPGARVVFTDNRFIAGSSTPISRVDEEWNSFQLRRLEDLSTHEIMKNFPSPDELRKTLAPFSGAVEVLTTDYFWCASYECRRIGMARG